VSRVVGEYSGLIPRWNCSYSPSGGFRSPSFPKRLFFLPSVRSLLPSMSSPKCGRGPNTTWATLPQPNYASAPGESRALIAMLAALAILPAVSAFSAVPDYKLGDVAAEDVATPVRLLAIDPEATDALRQKAAHQAPFIVLHSLQAGRDAENELRDSVADARKQFMERLQRALNGRAPTEADLGSPTYARTLVDVAPDCRKGLPVEFFAPVWVRGQPDSAAMEVLLGPVREVMTQPILSIQAKNSLPADEPVRLIQVTSPTDRPTLRQLENSGQNLTAGKMFSAWRAARLVETSFPAGQENLGKFAATFVRPNAFLDTELTDLLRNSRMQGLAVNDTYEAAQIIVRKGQTIDRKVLSAIAEMRERSLIGALQTKLEQQESVAGQIKKQTKWFAAGLAVIAVALVLVLWRMRARPTAALVPVQSGLTIDGSGESYWRSRAFLAEAKAERAHAAIRSGALSWMREKLFQMLFRHRMELLAAQEMAGREMYELEQRLERLQLPLQERISAYERRIGELERNLERMGDENRELTKVRIEVAKERLTVARGEFQSN